MSIALRAKVDAHEARISELEKIVAELRESLAHLQGVNVGKQRETLTLEKRKSA